MAPPVFDRPPDIRASITLTRQNPVASGYRPAHWIGDYLTTGIHRYLDRRWLRCGETAEGTITFLTPEAYPYSLKEGMKLVFQEGERVVGYAVVLEVYNPLLKAQ